MELVYDAAAGTTALAIATPDGKIAIEDHFAIPNGEDLIPYSASNNLLVSGCVRLPSGVGTYETQAKLIADVRSFLLRYVVLSPAFEEIAAYYVLFSWVGDAFNEVPMLRLRGQFGSGKTRALLAIGSLCYKGFFASGASTVSPIFHILDAFGGTLLLDEADFRYSDATSDLVKILNNGTVRGLPVLRTLTNRHRELNPTAFRVFGPKIIAMREHFDDDALESRCITEEMGGRPLRSDIPLVTPDTLALEAEQMRNDLLAWRFAMKHRVAIAPERMSAELTPRGNQMALPLLSLVDDAEARQRIVTHIAHGEERALARYAAQPHVAVANVLDRLFRDGGSANVSIARLAREYNDAAGGQMPIKSVGHIVRKRLGLETRKSAGIFVIPAQEQSKVTSLVARYGIAANVQ